MICMIYSQYSTTVHDLDLPGRADIFPICYDLYDLYDLAHVAGWKPYNLHDLLIIGHISWDNGRLGSK